MRLLALAMALVITGILGFNHFLREDYSEPPLPPPSASVPSTQSPVDQYGKLVAHKEHELSESKVQRISDVYIRDVGGGVTDVRGTLENTDTIPHNAIVTFVFLDNKNNVIGTASGGITSLQPGQSQTVSALVTYDISAYKNVAVRVSDH